MYGHSYAAIFYAYKVAECVKLMDLQRRGSFSRLCKCCLPQMDRTGIKENGALFPAEKDWPEMEA